MIDELQAGFNQILIWLCHYLPMSPFRGFIQQLANYPYLKYLNWLFPVTEAIVVLEGYLAILVTWWSFRRIIKFGKLL